MIDWVKLYIPIATPPSAPRAVVVLSHGFGEHARGATAYNPFQSQADIGNLPPLANVEAPQDTQATGADTQREPQP